MSEAQKKNLVIIKDNQVVVKLDKIGGYSFEYFSDYEVNSYFDGNFLIININEPGVENG